MSEAIGSFRVSSDHPALPGHFPGNPVVPGVVLLDETIRLLEAAELGRVGRLLAVKFRRPVRPDALCHVYADGGADRLSVMVECEGETVVTVLASR